MKTLKNIAGYVIGAYTVLSLTACPQTNNGSDPTPAPAIAAQTCTMGINGQLVNQYGQACSSNTAYGCAGYTYNPTTGTYINPANGQQIPTYMCGGQNAIPYTSNPGAGYGSGCQGWTQYYQQQGYNVNYVPVNMGGGQLVCVDFNQLNQQYNFASYNQLYANPQYWYQNPPMAYNPGYYGGYGYSQCATNVSLGFGSAGFGAGVNLCF